MIADILNRAETLYGPNPAVRCGETVWTYRELARRCRAHAVRLRDAGVEPGDRVALIHANCHHALEAYFGAALLGAILVPVNTRLHPIQIGSQLSHAEVSVAVVDLRHEELALAVRDEHAGPLELLWTGAAGSGCGEGPIRREGAGRTEGGPGVPEPYTPEAIAQIYYTSGTTGSPKGVALSHRNICFHAMLAVAELGLCEDDTWAHIAPMYHLADAWATWSITWVGGCHLMIPRFETRAVLRALSEGGTTITNLVPTMLGDLVSAPEVRGASFPTLRALLSGGAPIAPDLVARIMKTFGCPYIQTYGLTETSPYLTMSSLPGRLEALPEEEAFRFRAMTGKPVPGVRLRVVSSDGTPVPADGESVGEIVVRGESVFQGYWRNRKATDEAIRDGWFHTGDLAVLDPEGFVQIVDRKKDVIISGGENVYSIEVESALSCHPDVFEASVIGIPDDRWGETVRAVVVPRPGRTLDPDDLIEFCRGRLARYQVPRSIVVVDRLPRTGSGKIAKGLVRERFGTGGVETDRADEEPGPES